MEATKTPKLPLTLKLITDVMIIVIFAWALLISVNLFTVGEDEHFSSLIGSYIFQLQIIPLFESILMIIVLLSLRKIFKNIARNHFFNTTNVAALRKLAVITVAGGILISLLHAAFTLYQAAVNGRPLIEIFYALKWKTVFFGLIILLIAQSFKTGEHLRAEQELTI